MRYDFDLSIITPSYRRPKQLEHCLEQVASQSLGSLRVEHIVVGDGPESVDRNAVETSSSRLIESPERRGLWGAGAKDVGIANAHGEYVCFWDDDNLYEPHAAASLYVAASGYDIGVVQCCWKHPSGSDRIIPSRWTGTFRMRHVDSMCLCVRQHVAAMEPWDDGSRRYANDFRWAKRLEGRGTRIRFVPVVIGIHT